MTNGTTPTTTGPNLNLVSPDSNGTEPAAPSTPSPLWFVDRSRIETGMARCARARYLTYHAGPTGYGLTARRTALPLATGTSVHGGLESCADIMRRHDRLPDLGEMRAIAASVVASYKREVEARGFRGILGGPQTELTILEQMALIEGLIWTIRVKFLPWLHEHYRLIAIEEERLHLLDCSCGAPRGDIAEHERRGCSAKAFMIRTDLLAQRRGGSTLAYFDLKTTGYEGDSWTEQWETKPQLGIGTLGALERYGAEVTEIYILGLMKGRRVKDTSEGSDGRKIQHSTLCYGYRRPANPPLQPDDWVWAYQWTDEATGEVKRASRAHRRTGIWELEASDFPLWRSYAANDPQLTPVEWWTRMQPASLLEKVCFILGPMNRQDRQLASYLDGVVGEEARWQVSLWELYELQRAGMGWASDAFQRALDRRIPCSWNCRPFGAEHQCEFVPICHRHQGWDAPLGSQQYQPRLPHHTPELQQAIARGLLPEEAAAIEEEER